MVVTVSLVLTMRQHGWWDGGNSWLPKNPIHLILTPIDGFQMCVDPLLNHVWQKGKGFMMIEKESDHLDAASLAHTAGFPTLPAPEPGPGSA